MFELALSSEEKMKVVLLQIGLLALFSIISARAAQNVIADYKQARTIFWSVLYPAGGSTL